MGLIFNLVWFTQFVPCKGIQDSLRFWISRRGFWNPIAGFQIFFRGTWIPDSNCYCDSEFLQLYSRFQGRGFRILIVSGILDSCSCIPDSKAQDSGFHKQRFPRFRIPHAKISCFPESGVPYSERHNRHNLVYIPFSQTFFGFRQSRLFGFSC